MAHKMDGTWSYFEATLGNSLREDGKMKLVIPDNGNVNKDESKHKNRKLSGTAKEKDIDLDTEDTVTGEKRKLIGDLIFDKTLFGVRRMIIAGTWEILSEDEEQPLETAPELTQDEGIWVITKP